MKIQDTLMMKNYYVRFSKKIGIVLVLINFLTGDLLAMKRSAEEVVHAKKQKVATAEAAQETITIIDENCKEILLPKKIALQAITIKDLYEAASKQECNEITISAIPCEQLALIADFMWYRSNYEHKFRLPLFQSFIAQSEKDASFQKLLSDKDALISLLKAGNFLQFRLFMEFVAYQIVKKFLPPIIEEDENVLKAIAQIKEIVEEMAKNLPPQAAQTLRFVSEIIPMICTVYESGKMRVVAPVIYSGYEIPLALQDLFEYHPNDYFNELKVTIDKETGFPELGLHNQLLTSLEGITTKFNAKQRASIKNLYLTGNHIHVLTKDILKDFPNLLGIDIRKNGLKVIAPDAFAGTPFLEIIEISENTDLTFIDPSAFLYTPYLKRLYIVGLRLEPGNMQAIKNAVQIAWKDAMVKKAWIANGNPRYIKPSQKFRKKILEKYQGRIPELKIFENYPQEELEEMESSQGEITSESQELGSEEISSETESSESGE